MGPMVGGFIVHWWSWRWVFYVNLPVGIVAMVAPRWRVSRDRRAPRRSRLDLAGRGPAHRSSVAAAPRPLRAKTCAPASRWSPLVSPLCAGLSRRRAARRRSADSARSDSASAWSPSPAAPASSPAPSASATSPMCRCICRARSASSRCGRPVDGAAPLRLDRRLVRRPTASCASAFVRSFAPARLRRGGNGSWLAC